MRVLIFGVNGMLGNTAFRLFSQSRGIEVWGTVRREPSIDGLGADLSRRIKGQIDVEDRQRVADLIFEIQPDVVINCVGVVKQLADASDPLVAIPINSIFPHQLAEMCERQGARLIHISTDCVFSGRDGFYVESDTADARDLYGLSKLLGEVVRPHAVTIRTSIIGHELDRNTGLLEWFLAQQDDVRGFTNAFFSGLTTVELAKVIKEYVIPNSELNGLYHVSAERISKFELLKRVSETYSKEIEIVPDESVVIDRSLVSDRFRQATGYQPPNWPQLTQEMHDFR